MAAAAAARGDVSVAGRLWGFVCGLTTPLRPQAAEYDEYVKRIADDPTFREALAAGERLSLNEAVEYALSLDSS